MATTKHPVSVMVWGCFSNKGVGRLRIFENGERVIQKVNLHVLKNELQVCNVLDKNIIPKEEQFSKMTMPHVIGRKPLRNGSQGMRWSTSKIGPVKVQM